MRINMSSVIRKEVIQILRISTMHVAGPKGSDQRVEKENEIRGLDQTRYLKSGFNR